MSSRRPPSRLLVIVTVLMLSLAALPAATAAQGDDAAATCGQGAWETLAPTEDPTVAFASEGDCVSYVNGGGDLVDLQAAPEAPVDTDGPGASEDAPGHDPDGPGASEDTPGQDGDTGAPDGSASDAARACQQGGWDDLAPLETPLDAFDSQADCIRYAADGGDTVVLGATSAARDCALARSYNFTAGIIPSLARLDLSGCDLSGQNMSNANLTGADLAGADLTGTNLSSAILFGAHLNRTTLIGTNLNDAELVGAHLTDVNLFKVNLRNAVLAYAFVSNVRMSYTDLTGADLSNVNTNAVEFVASVCPDGTSSRYDGRWTCDGHLDMP